MRRIGGKGIVLPRRRKSASRKTHVGQGYGVTHCDTKHRFPLEDTGLRCVLHVGVSGGVHVRRSQTHCCISGGKRTEGERHRAGGGGCTIAHQRYGTGGILHCVRRIVATNEF